jgi:hypothetical protein
LRADQELNWSALIVWLTGGYRSKENASMKTCLGAIAFFALLSPSLAVAEEEKAGPHDNQPPKGFTALFNGKDLTNWQGLVDIKVRARLSPEEREARQKQANEHVLPHWTVKDGILNYDGKGNNLQTIKDYGNFEMYVDWKINKKGDSGIYLRGNPQVQIWDKSEEGSGGLWNNKKHPNKPLKIADKPIGQWNTFHIIMKGDRVTVFLNGEKVVDDTPLENYWDPGQPLPSKGPIELQHHGDQLWFKNIYVRELPD